MGEVAVSRECGIDYRAGKLLDLYVPGIQRSSTAVLLWHGSGGNERDVLEPLARRIALTGMGVIVPDWSTDDGSSGRNDLTASVLFARSDLATSLVTDRTVLVGWSLGASAGLDVVLRPELVDGWHPAAFIGISGGYQGSPFRQKGQRDLAIDPSVALALIHGSEDEVVPVDRSRITFEQLREAGQNVTLQELPTDHAGVIGTVYDPAQLRCVPATDSSRLAVLATVASVITGLAFAD
jgi:predicted esterase